MHYTKSVFKAFNFYEHPFYNAWINKRTAKKYQIDNAVLVS